MSGFCIMAPAQPSATVLPCIQPCFEYQPRYKGLSRVNELAIEVSERSERTIIVSDREALYKCDCHGYKHAHGHDQMTNNEWRVMSTSKILIGYEFITKLPSGDFLDYAYTEVGSGHRCLLLIKDFSFGIEDAQFKHWEAIWESVLAWSGSMEVS